MRWIFVVGSGGLQARCVAGSVMPLKRRTALSAACVGAHGTQEVCEWMQAFDVWMQTERVLSVTTQKTYLSDLKQFLVFMCAHTGGEEVSGLLLASLERQTVRAFFAHRLRQGVQVSGNARALSALKTFFGFLERVYHVPPSIVQQMKGPRVPRRLPRPLDVDSATDLSQGSETVAAHTLSWVRARDTALWMTLYGAGLRVSEALALNQNDVPKVWHAGSTLCVRGKGSKQRHVPLLEVVHQAMKCYQACCPFGQASGGTDCDPLFWGVRGKRLHVSVVARAMVQLRAYHGWDARTTAHSLRHSFASHLLAAGASLRHVQELLGHASLGTTQHYTEISDQHVRDVYKRAHPHCQK